MTIKFKDDTSKDTMMLLHPVLLSIFFGYMVPWLEERGVDIFVTSAIRGRLSSSVSNTHEEGRAIDIRCKDWSDTMRRQFATKFNHFFAAKYGAIGYKTGLPKLVVVHGTGDNIHCHLQVRKNLPRTALLEDLNGK